MPLNRCSFPFTSRRGERLPFVASRLCDGCVFCATAKMPTRRNLETWEIIDQFIHPRDGPIPGPRVTGAVFMGMGEPFLNYDRVLAAATLLVSLRGLGRRRSITISTVGLVPEIDRYTEEARPFRLAISLGAATDKKRSRAGADCGPDPVEEVMAAARRHALARQRARHAGLRLHRRSQCR